MKKLVVCVLMILLLAGCAPQIKYFKVGQECECSENQSLQFEVCKADTLEITDGSVAIVPGVSSPDWKIMDSGIGSPPEHLLGVWARGNRAVAVGTDRMITESADGGITWTASKLADNNVVGDVHLQSVWGSSPTDVFAVGQMGTIVRNNGTPGDWIGKSCKQSEWCYGWLFGVWSSDQNNVLAVGYEYPTNFGGGSDCWVAGYDGTNWQSQNLPNNCCSGVILRDVWGTNQSDVFAVGENGKILHYTTGGWSTMDSNTANHLYGVSGSTTSGTIFAVGDDGTILRYNVSDATWKSVNNSGVNEPLRGVWVNIECDHEVVYVVGNKGVILRSTDSGNTWHQMTSEETWRTLYDVHGTGDGPVLAVGVEGRILRYVPNCCCPDGTGYSKKDADGCQSGCVIVAPIETTDYTLEAKSVEGGSDSEKVTVWVDDPVISSFTVAPTQIYLGDCLDFSWNVSNALSAEITPIVGIGPLLPDTGSTHSISGNQTVCDPVCPKSDDGYVRFTLTAKNPCGYKDSTVAVKVLDRDCPCQAECECMSKEEATQRGLANKAPCRPLPCGCDDTSLEAEYCYPTCPQGFTCLTKADAATLGLDLIEGSCGPEKFCFRTCNKSARCDCMSADTAKTLGLTDCCRPQPCTYDAHCDPSYCFNLDNKAADCPIERCECLTEAAAKNAGHCSQISSSTNAPPIDQCKCRKDPCGRLCSGDDQYCFGCPENCICLTKSQAQTQGLDRLCHEETCGKEALDPTTSTLKMAYVAVSSEFQLQSIHKYCWEQCPEGCQCLPDAMGDSLNLDYCTDTISDNISCLYSPDNQAPAHCRKLCPQGCQCLLDAEGDNLNLGWCTDKSGNKTTCGYNSDGQPIKHCRGSCPTGCQCLTPDEGDSRHLEPCTDTSGSLVACEYGVDNQPTKNCFKLCPGSCQCLPDAEGNSLGLDWCTDASGGNIPCEYSNGQPTKHCRIEPCPKKCECLTQAQASPRSCYSGMNWTPKSESCSMEPCGVDEYGLDKYCCPVEVAKEPPPEPKINDFRVTNEPVCIGAAVEYYMDIENAVLAVILEPEDTTTPVELPGSTLKSTGIYPIGFKGASNGKPSKTIWRFGDQSAGDTWTFPATLKVTGKDGTSVTKTITVKVGPCPPAAAVPCAENCDCLTEKEALDLGYTTLCQQEACSAPGEPEKFCYSRCPEGCSCVTEKEADEQGYTISCSDEICDPTSKEAKYCFSPPVQPCSQRCQCLTQAQAKEYGLSDAKRCQSVPCKQDPQGRDMYCYPKPKTPVVDVTADRSFVTLGGDVRVCWKVAGEGITEVLFTAAGGKPTRVDPQGCKTLRPTQQTRYLVTAKSAAGSGQDSVTVGVGQPTLPVEVRPPTPPVGDGQPPPVEVCPTINSFTANCPSCPTTPPVKDQAVAPKGGPGIMSWSAISCPACTASWSVTSPAGTTVSISGIGAVGLSGSTQVQRGATYTLTARYGSCVRTATVQVPQ